MPMDVITKLRYIDNQISKWMMRHFYLIFFQGVLFIIFLFWFVNLFKVIDVTFLSRSETIIEKTLVTQSVNQTIIVFLLLLNSFWMLYLFSGVLRIRTILKDIQYHLTRQNKPRPYPQQQQHPPR
jgi:Na+/H+ antiporter NhaC